MTVDNHLTGMRRGRFITFEGGEGAGKSTQIARLSGALEAIGLTVVATREPGGTPGAEHIRDLLVNGAADRWDAASEALLNFAARHDHVEKRIRPALAAGTWVLSDRFADSTMAYQGYAGGMGRQAVEALYAVAVGGLRPDLTLVLDLPVEVGLARAAARRGGEDRFERKGEAFHRALRAAFLDIAGREPERCVLIDASQPPDRVAALVRRAVADRLDLELPE